MFKSNEELFQAVNDVIAKFEKNDSNSAAQELKKGLQSINGLTDGWALFLESIEHVQKNLSPNIDPNDRSNLQAIREAAYFAVYRKKSKPWWQLW